MSGLGVDCLMPFWNSSIFENLCHNPTKGGEDLGLWWWDQEVWIELEYIFPFTWDCLGSSNSMNSNSSCIFSGLCLWRKGLLPLVLCVGACESSQPSHPIPSRPIPPANDALSKYFCCHISYALCCLPPSPKCCRKGMSMQAIAMACGLPPPELRNQFFPIFQCGCIHAKGCALHPVTGALHPVPDASSRKGTFHLDKISGGIQIS